MTILEQIFRTKEFNKYLEEEMKDSSFWETTKYDKPDDCDTLVNAKYDYPWFIRDIACWGGYISEKFEENLNSPDLVLENHFLIGSNFREIDSVSLNGELLMWSLHED